MLARLLKHGDASVNGTHDAAEVTANALVLVYHSNPTDGGIDVVPIDAVNLIVMADLDALATADAGGWVHLCGHLIVEIKLLELRDASN
jgi:hypothetical protein